jgi:putative FmdB family regulatory protein
MPIYEYRCADCSHTFEKRRPMSMADAEIACPQCESTHTRRGISRFAAFSKGNGGTSHAVGGGGGCEGCGSHSCGSCGRH